MRGKMKVVGRLSGIIRGRDGRIKHKWECPNLVVTTGRNHIADQMGAQVQSPMGYMAIGTGTNPAVATDVALQSELDRNALTSKDTGEGGDAHKIVYVCGWAAGDGTGAITEAGIFNSPSAGDMLCRTSFTVKNKDATDSMTLTWTVSFTA